MGARSECLKVLPMISVIEVSVLVEEAFPGVQVMALVIWMRKNDLTLLQL